MNIKKCQECPLKDTCNLVKMDCEEQCSVIRDYLGIKREIIEGNTVTTEIHFESDLNTNDFENEVK